MVSLLQATTSARPGTEFPTRPNVHAQFAHVSNAHRHVINISNSTHMLQPCVWTRASGETCRVPYACKCAWSMGMPRSLSFCAFVVFVSAHWDCCCCCCGSALCSPAVLRDDRQDMQTKNTHRVRNACVRVRSRYAHIETHVPAHAGRIRTHDTRTRARTRRLMRPRVGRSRGRLRCKLLLAVSLPPSSPCPPSTRRLSLNL